MSDESRCPICDLADGFHDEVMHAREVRVPRRLLLPLASQEVKTKVRLTDEEIAQRRADAAERKAAKDGNTA